MATKLTYDIDHLIDHVATKEANYVALHSLWNELEPQPRDSYLDPEKVFFDIVNFGMGMGNGFGRRLDFNHPEGLKDFSLLVQAIDQIDAPQTKALLQEVADLLDRIGVTPSLCEEEEMYCFWELDRVLDASDLLPEEIRNKQREEYEGEHASLYEVFEHFSELAKLDSRWGHIETPEIFPALISYLSTHRDVLRTRKP